MSFTEDRVISWDASGLVNQNYAVSRPNLIVSKTSLEQSTDLTVYFKPDLETLHVNVTVTAVFLGYLAGQSGEYWGIVSHQDFDITFSRFSAEEIPVTISWNDVYDDYAACANFRGDFVGFNEGRVLSWGTSGLVTQNFGVSRPMLTLTKTMLEQACESGDDLIIYFTPELLPLEEEEYIIISYDRYVYYMTVWYKIYYDDDTSEETRGRLLRYGGAAHYNELLVCYGLDELPPDYYLYGTYAYLDESYADFYDYWADEIAPGLIMSGADLDPKNFGTPRNPQP